MIRLPDPKPASAIKMVRVRILKEKNIRNAHSINGADMGGNTGVGELQPKDLATIWPESEIAEDGYTWVYVQQLSGSQPGLTGWAALTQADYEVLPITKPLPPAPEAVPDAPAPPSASAPATVGTFTQNPPKTPQTRQIVIEVTASDEVLEELTAALLNLSSTLSQVCSSWLQLKVAASPIEVKSSS